MSQTFKRHLVWKEICKHTLWRRDRGVCVLSLHRCCSIRFHSFMAEQIINEKQDEFCFSWRAQTHSTPPLLTRPRFEELIWTIYMQMTRHFSFDIYHLQCLCICKSVLKISVWSEQLCEAKQELLFWDAVVIMCVHRPFLLTDEMLDNLRLHKSLHGFAGLNHTLWNRACFHKVA